MVHTLKERNFK